MELEERAPKGQELQPEAKLEDLEVVLGLVGGVLIEESTRLRVGAVLIEESTR